MKDLELPRERLSDLIVLEKQFKFLAYTYVKHLQNEDYSLRIEFFNLSFDDFKKVLELSRLKKSIQISSNLILREDYEITHIVVIDYLAKSDFSVVWKCLSDKAANQFYNLKNSYPF
jgi:hypothetical protein